MADFTWYVLDVNPEPWAIGPVSVGRKKGGVYPVVGRNQQLWNYQQAIKEAIDDLPDGGRMFQGKLELMFFFWRQRSEYETPQARTHRKHEADVTNLQKGTEDALQGVLFKNDKDTKTIHAVMVDQGPEVHGRVVIGIRVAELVDMSAMPDEVRMQAQSLEFEELDNEWRG